MHLASWTTGLLNCFDDCNICFYGFFCTPCLYGENAKKIDGSSSFRSCCVWMLLSACGLCCLVHSGKRHALRAKYSLKEDCDDRCAITFCAACATCQEARELKNRSEIFTTGPVPVIVFPTGADTYPSLGKPEIMRLGLF